MQPQTIADYLLTRYPGVVAVNAWGEQSFFYNPGGLLPRGVYFATLKDKDGDNDKASKLDRDGVFRFNFGVSKASYENTFGTKPERPAAGNVVATGHDFTQCNCLLPHPVYAWMGWVCILNPEQKTFESLLHLMDEAYDLVVEKQKKRIKSL